MTEPTTTTTPGPCASHGCDSPAESPHHWHCARCWRLAPRTARVAFWDAVRGGNPLVTMDALCRCVAAIRAKRPPAVTTLSVAECEESE